MPHPIASRKRAHALCGALFLLSFAVLVITNSWWPAILLVIGTPLALRQYLLGKQYDGLVSLFVFGGLYVTLQFDLPWRILIPVIFTLGAIYILLREFFGPEEGISEVDEEEEVLQEIDEDKK